MSIHGRSGGQLEESAARGGCNRSTRPRERIYRGHRVYDASRHKEDNRRLIGSLRLKRTCAFDRKETLSDRFSSRALYWLQYNWQSPVSRNARGKRLANIGPRDLRLRFDVVNPRSSLVRDQKLFSLPPRICEPPYRIIYRLKIRVVANG